MPFSSAHLPPGLTVPAEAAQAYELGLQAFEAGDYASAWVNFANFANTVGPVPAALANVAESAFMEQYFDEARQTSRWRSRNPTCPSMVGLRPEERPDLKDGAEALLERMARDNPLLVVRG